MKSLSVRESRHFQITKPLFHSCQRSQQQLNPQANNTANHRDRILRQSQTTHAHLRNPRRSLPQNALILSLRRLSSQKMSQWISVSGKGQDEKVAKSRTPLLSTCSSLRSTNGIPWKLRAQTAMQAQIHRTLLQLQPLQLRFRNEVIVLNVTEVHLGSTYRSMLRANLPPQTTMLQQ